MGRIHGEGLATVTLDPVGATILGGSERAGHEWQSRLAQLTGIAEDVHGTNVP